MNTKRADGNTPLLLTDLCRGKDVDAELKTRFPGLQEISKTTGTGQSQLPELPPNGSLFHSGLGNAGSVQNLNARDRAKGTNVPFGPHSTQFDPSQKNAADRTALENSIGKVVYGLHSPSAADLEALRNEVDKTLASTVPADGRASVVDGVVSYFVGLRDAQRNYEDTMKLVRNIR